MKQRQADFEGTRYVPTVTQRYEVQILYREPLYEVWSDSGARRPFVACYRGIEAASLAEAERIARGRFDFVADHSRAKWRREVVDIVVNSVE